MLKQSGGVYMEFPQWVVSDLDETLLHHDRTISPRTLSVLDEVRSKGCRFAIATTRSHSYAQQFIDILKPDAMVLSGGAVAFVGDKQVYHMPLEGQLVDRLLSEFRLNPLVKHWVVDSSSGRYDRTGGIQLPFPHDVMSLFLWTGAAHVERLVGNWGEVTTVTALWEPDMYRISHVNATKHAALKQVLEGFAPSSVVCFGDDLMDVGMLAGYVGVAVANAKIEAKEAATHLTFSNEEDGVARWLATHVLS
jgi:HAD superfamily hydrolase (TIGR01484 family)